MSVDLAVELKGVCKTYRMGGGIVRALDKVDLTIPMGDVVSIVGPSGSGKSTMLNIIGCIDIPDRGGIRVLGRDISRMSDRQLTKLRLERIGFIFQQFYLIPTLKAGENVELPMKELGIGRSDRRRRAHALLESMGIGARADHYPNQLSGGEQQRVAIARALANDPKILLADEPTGEVDSKTTAVIVDILKRLNRERGVTIVIVTHDLGVGGQAKRMVSMKDGAIVEEKRFA